MSLARFFLAVLIVAGAALAACSGNFGSATAPSGIIPSGPLSGIQPTASPTPSSVNAILTYGESDAFQTLPSVQGYGGSLAFPVPSPKPSGFSPVPVGVTVAVVAPTNAPDFNLETAGKHGKRRAHPARPLLYISLLATRDISLGSYPRIAIDVPRDIVTTYRLDELGLALYNPGEKSEVYRLAVAELDTATPPPTAAPATTGSPAGSPGPGASGASPSASGSPSPAATLTAGSPPPGPPGRPPGFGGFGAAARPGAAAPVASATLPPQRILFAGTAAPLKLAANVAAVFALYALPHPKPSPSPSPSPKGSPSVAPAARASAGASSLPSPAGGAASPPAASPSAGASAAASALPSPAPSSS